MSAVISITQEQATNKRYQLSATMPRNELPIAQTDVSTQDRLAGVDVLRGLCILSVLLHHSHLRFTLSKLPVNDVLPETLNQVLFWTGLYAVMAFFVISGFLITGISIRRWGVLGEVHAGRFYR